MASMDDLKRRIKELEDEVQSCRRNMFGNEGVLSRKRIDVMSSEVVDSNPYRFVVNQFGYSRDLALVCQPQCFSYLAETLTLYDSGICNSPRNISNWSPLSLISFRLNSN